MNELIASTDTSVLIFGHTHIPFVRSFKDRLFINTGSVGQPKDGDNRAGFIIADFSSNGISVITRRVAYDIKLVTSEMYDLGLPAEHIEVLITGRSL